jgi:methyl-accepting chemotaxis protein
MIQRFRNLQVSTQIVLLSALVCASVFSGFTAFVAWEGDRAALEQTETDLHNQLKIVRSVLSYVYANAQERSQRESEHFMGLLKVKLRVDGSSSRTGDNPEVPTIRVGDEVLNGNNRYLDEMKRLSGTEAAILVKKDGELIRAATLLKDKDGKSMAGTAMAKDEGVTKNILKGERFSGIVWRNGKFYMMYGVPVFDDNKNVIGGITLRVDLSGEISGMKDALKKIGVGKTGYIFAYAPSGDERIATFVMHPELEGKTLADAYKNDTPARERALSLITDHGGVSLHDYADSNDGGRLKQKITVYEYLPDFNWMIGAGSFVEEFVEQSHAMRNLLALMSLLCGVVTVLLLHWMTRARLQPLTGIIAEVRRIGQGDLSLRIATGTAASRNEIDVLGRELNATIEQIGVLVGGIVESAAQVTGAGRELEAATRQVAAGSSKQSEAACSVAASVEQLSVSIAHVADNARVASEVTAAANAVAEKGGAVVHDAVTEMENIAGEMQGAAQVIQSLGDRSQQISGIVKVIKDIADQTNLLALNAAIEAARAGEQGRGFAVVADEVRKLAERTTMSTSEIAAMISGVQSETQLAVNNMKGVTTRMQHGVALAKQAGESLVAIRARAVETDSLVQEIAGATREQTTAGEQIARNVEEIAGKAEENAGISAQTQRSVSELLGLSQRLTSMVQRFKLGGGAR